jgi:hypothetical protein
VYQVTHKMMIYPSKCRPLNIVSIGLNRSIPHHRLPKARLHQSQLLEVLVITALLLEGTGAGYWNVTLTVFEVTPPAETTMGTLPAPAKDCGITTLI